MEKVRVIKNKSTSDTVDKQVVAMREIKKTLKGVTPFEKLAEDNFFKKNFYYPGGQQAFPDAPKMQYVERYYPHAVCGPLAFDCLGHMDSKELFELKRQHLSKAGIKYVIVTSEATDLDLMEQLA